MCFGVADDQGRWYLRYRLEWDDDGQSLTGFFALTLVPLLTEAFGREFGQSDLIIESSREYFDRIRV